MSRVSNTEIKERNRDASRLTEVMAVSPLPSQLLRSKPARHEWRCPCASLIEQLGVKLEPAKGSSGSADPIRTWLPVIDAQPLHLRDQSRSRQAQPHGGAIPAAEHAPGLLKGVKDMRSLRLSQRHRRGRFHLGQFG